MAEKEKDLETRKVEALEKIAKEVSSLDSTVTLGFMILIGILGHHFFSWFDWFGFFLFLPSFIVIKNNV